MNVNTGAPSVVTIKRPLEVSQDGDAENDAKKPKVEEEEHVSNWAIVEEPWTVQRENWWAGLWNGSRPVLRDEILIFYVSVKIKNERIASKWAFM